MKIHTVIVDDERPLCDEMEYLLQSYPNVEVVSSFCDSHEALDYLTKNHCDLLFCDIDMPQMSGIELAECLGEMDKKILIVFVTAYDEYARDAFDTPAVGYLSKPVTSVKLSRILRKVVALCTDDPPASQALSASGAPLKKNFDAQWLTVEKDGRMYPVKQNEIILACVRNKYVYVRTASGEYQVRQNMQELEAALAGKPFLRVHRQFIINLDFVAEIIPLFNGNYVVHMKGCGREDIPVSRNHLPELKQALGFR